MSENFSVTILGSSAAIPTSNNITSCQLIQHQSSSYLIDCGEGAQIMFRKNKLSFQKLNAIYISHLHGDHIFGLFGLMASMSLLGRKKKLKIYGPKGIASLIKNVFLSTETFISFPYSVSELINNKKQAIYKNKNIEVFSFPLNHNISCFGFLFQETDKPRRLIKEKIEEYQIPKHLRNGITQGNDYQWGNKTVKNEAITLPPKKKRSYAYCSDTLFSPEIINNLYGIDLLYHEATFADEEKSLAIKTYHSTASQAGQIAFDARVKRLIIGHLSLRYKDKNKVLEQVKERFKHTNIAFPGTRFDIL